jgi:hypothetical protein
MHTPLTGSSLVNHTSFISVSKFPRNINDTSAYFIQNIEYYINENSFRQLRTNLVRSREFIVGKVLQSDITVGTWSFQRQFSGRSVNLEDACGFLSDRSE